MHASKLGTGSDANGIQEIHVNTWEEFERQLMELRKHPTDWSELPLLYRGQTESDWALETTLERNGRARMVLHEYYRLILKVRPQIEAFTGRQWVIPRYPSVRQWTKEYDAFSVRLTRGALPGYDYMAYLRHHGFPSPLLDWTRSLHVAAFFAFRRQADSTSEHINDISCSKANTRFASGLTTSGASSRMRMYSSLAAKAIVGSSIFLRQSVSKF